MTSEVSSQFAISGKSRPAMPVFFWRETEEKRMSGGFVTNEEEEKVREWAREAKPQPNFKACPLSMGAVLSSATELQ